MFNKAIEYKRGTHLVYLSLIFSKVQLVSRLSQLTHVRSFGLDFVACSSLGALCSLKPCKSGSQLAKNTSFPQYFTCISKLNKKSLAASYFPAKSSIIGVRELDFRVRNGNGYYLSTMTTRQKYKIKTKSVKPEKRCTQDEYNINGTDNMVKPHGLLVMLG